MKRVLLVDDDPVVLQVYTSGLAAHGFLVDTAADGMAAIKAMRGRTPDVVVLDLMMPKLTGADVLKLMRSQPELTALPVIVFSNAYMDGITADAAAAGAQKGLRKVTCTPSILVSAINELLEGSEAAEDPSTLLTVPKQAAVIPGAASDQLQPDQKTASPDNHQGQTFKTRKALPGQEPEMHLEIRQRFFEHADAANLGLRNAFHLFKTAPTENQRGLRLEDLYRKVHFLSSSAGLAKCDRLAQMAAAFEALLFRLMDNAGRITQSALRTITMGIDYIEVLLQEAKEGRLNPATAGKVLIVDDDAVSTRMVVWALKQAGLQPTSEQDPRRALQWLKEKHADLVLLDVVMPHMDGFELCRRMRLLPGYKDTPVIFVTAHSDFEMRSKTALAGGSDLIGKPVLPTELAVKVVMHLLENEAEVPLRNAVENLEQAG